MGKTIIGQGGFLQNVINYTGIKHTYRKWLRNLRGERPLGFHKKSKLTPTLRNVFSKVPKPIKQNKASEVYKTFTALPSQT